MCLCYLYQKLFLLSAYLYYIVGSHQLRSINFKYTKPSKKKIDRFIDLIKTIKKTTNEILFLLQNCFLRMEMVPFYYLISVSLILVCDGMNKKK